MNGLFETMTRDGHEQVVFCSDATSKLRAIIAIHDTTLGPALGGVRMRPYRTDEEALIDVLRLSRGMTYKNALAGLKLGGGKAVIIGDPAKDKGEMLFRSLGSFVQSLNGRYLIAEDMGIGVEDMMCIMKKTKWVCGLPTSIGGSGDPSPFTAFGVLRGMQACVCEVFGSDSLEGRLIAIQGLGHVGYTLAELIHKEGARLICSEPINADAAEKVRDELGATIVGEDDIYDVECDIFAPCAVGGILNDQTIPRLKCKIVAGAANNQLAVGTRDGLALVERDILYAPDYAINSGGVINISVERDPGGYSADMARSKVAQIYDIMTQLIDTSKLEGIPTHEVADKLAKAMIERGRQAAR